jgi:protein-S-isoprenylcysteine O-methyltransferase Ste14
MPERALPGWLFRTARPSGPAWNLVKTLVQVIVVWSIALGLLPWVAVSVEAWLGVSRWGWPGRVPLGVLLFLAGSSIGLWSAWLMAVEGAGTPVPFDAARHLVVQGPYRLVRNPMAVSGIVQLAGITIAVGSLAVGLLALAGGVMWHVVIRPSEERFLVEQFGEQYTAYRAEVLCWIPRWPPYGR